MRAPFGTVISKKFHAESTEVTETPGGLSVKALNAIEETSSSILRVLELPGPGKFVCLRAAPCTYNGKARGFQKVKPCGKGGVSNK